LNTLSAHWLLIILILLILVSGFFSSAETGIMSINRYRLRHLVRKEHPAAKRINELLERPDRLLGVILIGNTFANVFAAAIATILAVRFWGGFGVAAATFILTFAILIFAEITPKILAALYPERIAYNASLPLKYLLKILYPVVWLASEIANLVLRLFRVKRSIGAKIDVLSHDELRTIVNEAVGKSTTRSHEMLLGILDLNKATVEDIMVPRNDIIGIDLDEDWPDILAQLRISQHTRLPIYRGSIDNVEGILHLRKVLNIFAESQPDKSELLQAADQVYFIPEGTPLNKQLLNFQQQKIRIGMVVDEYGDIQGLVTLEDILEEIVGQFTTDLAAAGKDIIPQNDGSYLIDGSTSIREINRTLGLELPTEGPKTLNGLIVEHLETIPDSGICLRIARYPIEVLQVEGNTIKTARIQPNQFK
jgi:Mg2+/Co2+ transporter CorB